MSEIVIETCGLQKSYGSAAVLRGVDLKIPRGEVTGLLGLNGAGKSTLIRCLLGLQQPTSGTATVFGCNAWDLTEEHKARLGYVPQEVILLNQLKVLEMLAYTEAFYANWDAAFVQRLLQRWDISPQKLCGQLSPGEKQKLGIVLALGHSPELLILDEPAASLDPQARRIFLESLLELAADEQRTILFSTHITSDLERAASHLAILQGGVVRLHSDLDSLKDRVKRLKILNAVGRPKSTDLPGVLTWNEKGGTVSATVDGYTEDLPERLRVSHSVDVLVENLNLEDVFLAFH